MTTKESPLHENFKKLSVQKSVYDTLFSKRFDGIDCRVIDAPGARKQLKAGLNPIQLLKAMPNSRFIAKQLHMPYMKLFFGVLFSGWKTARQLAYMDNGFESLRLATQEGDIENGWLTVGQVTGLVKDIPSVKELMERMVAQAEAASGKISQQTAK
jgi:enoyl-[acyl-carrier protein] reductase II